MNPKVQNFIVPWDFFDFPHHLRRKRDEKEDKNNFFEKKLQKHLVV